MGDEPELVNSPDQEEPEDESRGLVASATQFSGPLPPPGVLQGYEDVVPGAAERIIAMAESEQNHRHHIQRESTNKHYAFRRTGQFFGLLVALGGLTTAGYIAYLGHPAAASVIGGTTLLGMVAVFVTGRLIRPADDAEEE